jgi:zinc/manganese transport system permease protein
MTLVDFVQPFVEFAFMRRALAGCMILALSTAPVGVFLMLRRLSLTGDALAHAILPGAACGYLIAGLNLYAMTAGGIVAGLVVAALAGLIARFTHLREDTSLATFYLMSLALGVIMVSLRGSPIDLMHLLFGSVLGLDDPALMFIAIVASITMLVFATIWRLLILECIDPGYLRSVGGSGAVAHFAFMGVMVLNLVAGYQALGTLLSVGLMVLPAAAARFWTRRIGSMISLAALLAMAASAFGLAISYVVRLPSGPAVIAVAGILYLVSVVIGPIGGILSRFAPSHHRAG